MSTEPPMDAPGPSPFDSDDAALGDRLQKFLAAAGVASRRRAEVMIRQRRVTVNGVVAELGQRVSPDDDVRVNGVRVGPQAPRYVMLNKPTGVVTTASDPEGRPTVVELVPSEVRLYPVGRLDFDTSGLLLLTNDGDLAHRLMHPSFGVTKRYQAMVSGQVSPATVRALSEGIDLEDGPTAPAAAKLVQASAQRSLVELTIHEGRNRQVRRMFDAVGHPVLQLARTAYGPLTLGALASGASRDLDAAEIRRLQKAAGLAPARHRDRDTSTSD